MWLTPWQRRYENHPPAHVLDLDAIEVEYVTLPGWQCSIAAARSQDDLPANALAYIRFIEEAVGVKVQWVGVGPEREASIRLF